MHGIERGPGDRPALARPALRRLIDVDPDVFAAEYWGERPLLTRHGDAFDDLFSLDAVDELVADRALRTPFVRMAAKGTVLAPDLFTGPGGFGAEIADQLDSAKVLAEFAAGATLVLQGLHRTWAPIAAFTRQLVADVGHPVQVNAYVTPASNRGFDPHYDTHDVFVIQIAGAKRWTIHAPVHVHPLADQPWTGHRDAVAARATQPPAIDAVFEPGDVLYLPRGWIHSAVAQGGTSVHLTLGVRAATRLDLLRRLIARAGDDPELRRPLAFGVDYTDADALAPDLAATVAAAGALLDRADPVDIAAAMQRGLADAVRPDPVRPLATVDLLAGLDPATPVGWRGSLRAAIVDGDSTVAIRLARKTVTLPAEASAAVHALHDGGALPAGALPDLDPDSSLVVSRRLLREGVLVPR